MSKIGIIGDRDLILGFKALGVELFPVSNKEETKNALEEAVKEKFSICFITEKWAALVLDEIKNIRKSTYPLVTIIPDASGSTGIGQEWIRESAIRAIGTDALFK